jgi:hypothetical protein
VSLPGMGRVDGARRGVRSFVLAALRVLHVALLRALSGPTAIGGAGRESADREWRIRPCAGRPPGVSQRG